MTGGAVYYFTDGRREQRLAGSIRDEANDPVAGVVVALPAFAVSTITDTWGHFELRVTAPYQDTVEWLARKDGYQTYEQYATLGNTELGFTLRKKP